MRTVLFNNPGSRLYLIMTLRIITVGRVYIFANCPGMSRTVLYNLIICKNRVVVLEMLVKVCGFGITNMKQVQVPVINVCSHGLRS